MSDPMPFLRSDMDRDAEHRCPHCQKWYVVPTLLEDHLKVCGSGEIRRVGESGKR